MATMQKESEVVVTEEGSSFELSFAPDIKTTDDKLAF
jgi:hypothetical protein